MTNPSPFALFVRGPSQAIFALSDQLGFEMEMQALAVSVFEDGPDSMHVQALYGTEAEALAAQASLDLSKYENFITQLPDEDWTAKSQAGLPPVQAGRFFVYGAHDKGEIPDGMPFPIQIEAGIAFGTGHHGTTKGCLLAFDELIREIQPQNVLDLGCGAGVLAIAAAKALNQSILASDIDPDAVEVSAANAALNEVGQFIQAVIANGMDDQVIAEKAPFDLIFANILAGPLMGLAPDITAAIAPDGYVILSGILDEQADTLIQCYSDQGLALKSHGHLSGWSTLTMQKPSS
jgi:ribosomal protein L11 methyltransferase